MWISRTPNSARSRHGKPLKSTPGKLGLSQDLESGWPKLAVVKHLGVLFFKGPKYTQITTTNGYLLIEMAKTMSGKQAIC